MAREKEGHSPQQSPYPRHYPGSLCSALGKYARGPVAGQGGSDIKMSHKALWVGIFDGPQQGGVKRTNEQCLRLRSSVSTDPVLQKLVLCVPFLHGW